MTQTTQKDKSASVPLESSCPSQKEKRKKDGWMTFLAEYRPIFAGHPIFTNATKAAGVIWNSKTAEQKEVKHPLL